MVSSLIRKLSDPLNQGSWALQFRKNRFRLYEKLIGTLTTPYTVLDVGGTEDFWSAMEFLPSKDFDICISNLSVEGEPSYDNVELVAGNACDMSEFEDNKFDVVFSNSVIEHVGDFSMRARMAEEVKRVGKRYFVQTPNRHFPIDPHFPFPFFQFFSLSIRATLLQSLPLAWVGRIKNRQAALDAAASVDLITRKELMTLFPDGQIFEEKLFGLTKSFIVYGGWD